MKEKDSKRREEVAEHPGALDAAGQLTLGGRPPPAGRPQASEGCKLLLPHVLSGISSFWF